MNNQSETQELQEALQHYIATTTSSLDNSALTTLTELTYQYATTLLANDLVAFSQHRGSKSVDVRDVLLIARKERRRLLPDLESFTGIELSGNVHLDSNNFISDGVDITATNRSTISGNRKSTTGNTNTKTSTNRASTSDVSNINNQASISDYFKKKKNSSKISSSNTTTAASVREKRLQEILYSSSSESSSNNEMDDIPIGLPEPAKNSLSTKSSMDEEDEDYLDRHSNARNSMFKKSKSSFSNNNSSKSSKSKETIDLLSSSSSDEENEF